MPLTSTLFLQKRLAALAWSVYASWPGISSPHVRLLSHECCSWQPRQSSYHCVFIKVFSSTKTTVFRCFTMTHYEGAWFTCTCNSAIILLLQWSPTPAINPMPSLHLWVPFCLQVEPCLAMVVSLRMRSFIALSPDNCFSAPPPLFSCQHCETPFQAAFPSWLSPELM